MQRREFTGCAAAFSLLACQKALGQTEREAAAEDGTRRETRRRRAS